MAEEVMAVVVSAGAGMSDGGETSNAAMTALVTYMMLEADLADERAKRLREQAETLARRFGVSVHVQDEYEIAADEMAPLDENGVPKYKGKKRGRKLKPRARKANPNRKKRKHTGYTLYMQEHYPAIKEANPEFASKDVITIVAKEWADLAVNAKAEWKSRAAATHDDDDDDEAAVAAAVAAEEVDDDDDDDDDDDEPAPPARRTKKSKR